MPKYKGTGDLLDPKVYRYLVNLWTFILYISILVDFVMQNRIDGFLGPICAVYVALLAVYTAEKEFERWHDYNIGRHPGEIYVFIWTVLVVCLLVLEVIYHGSYHVPTEVYTTYIVVVGILAITRKSRSNYLSRRKRNRN